MIAKMGRSGLIGLILGIGAVAFIRPLVPAAAILIIVLCIGISVGVGSIFRKR